MPAVRSDLDWAVFSDAPPWQFPRSGVRWIDVAPTLRDAARQEVPRLTRRRRVPPVGRLVVVVFVLGRALAPWWWRRRRGHYTTPEQSRAALSLRLRVAIEKLGATYIKLAQIISSGEGLFPVELVTEFKKCRDQVPAEPLTTVVRTVEHDLGARLGDVFGEFSPTPIAAASIAQVHRARLLSGEEVVVKVQRAAVATMVRKDLEVMSWIAPLLIGRIPVAALANPPALVELFAETIVEELDFRMEAANMVDIAMMMRELDNGGFVIPRPHPSLVTRRVLVMERLEGFAFDDATGMQRAGIDTAAVVRAGMVAFMEGALVHGVFHGDLHGGNLLVMHDGRTALLDFGIVGRLSHRRRLAFLRLMLGATTNDVRGQVQALCELGALPLDTDIDAVIVDLRLDQPTIDPTTLDGEELVKEVQRIVKALLAYGAKLPKELMLYVKNMVFIDGAIARLAPDLDLLAEVATITMLFTQRHGERLGRELGIDPDSIEFNFDSVKAGLGVDASTESLSYRELQRRRELIQRRMRDHVLN